MENVRPTCSSVLMLLIVLLGASDSRMWGSMLLAKDADREEEGHAPGRPGFSHSGFVGAWGEHT
jgi:hypothetical protein